jgi:threonine synthase
MFCSSRGGVGRVSFQDALLSGYAADGGLFVPENTPPVDHTQLASWKGLPYVDLCKNILSMYITDEDIPKKTLEGTT